jgi:transposase-like protein
MRPYCPRCKKQNPYKYGHVLNRQRWKCRSCSYAFTLQKMRYLPAEIVFKAAELYEADLSSNRIAKHLEISPTTVLKWVRLLSPSDGRIHRKRSRSIFPHEVTEAFRQMRQHRIIETDCKRYAALSCSMCGKSII